MPEQEQQPKKKKLRILCQIIKWIFIVLLGLLLIAGIYFQAPWKVLTLLAIILAALTILPKPARKWFWAGVGVVVIALVIWVFLPDRNGDWRSYTFDEEFTALEAKYAIPDSENAAVIYNKLLADYDPDTFYPDFWNDELDDLTDEPWSGKDYPEVAKWLTQHESTIKVLMQASKKEKCRFSVEVSYLELGKQYERLGPMMQWTELLTRAGNNDLGEGRSDQALQKYLCILQMAKHQYQQPTIIDLLVGIAIEVLATKQFNTFVVAGDATEEHLNVIEKALIDVKHDWSSDLPKILKFEKLLFKNTLGMFYEVNPEGRTRLNRGSGLSFSFCRQLKCGLPKRKAKQNYWRGKFSKTRTVFMWFYMPSSPQEASEIIDAGYERLYAMAEPDYDWQKGTEKPNKMFGLNYRYLVEHLAGTLKPAYHRIHDQYLRAIAQQRGSQIIVSLRRYKNKNGFWPVNLDDVKSMAPAEIFVDPINGGDFVYEITKENFRLYSKGKNNVDEGGKRDRGSVRMIY